jgi:ActR/RegA family two-component response regulator
VRSGENVLIVEDEDEWSGAYMRAVDTLGGHHTVKVAKDLASAERLIKATKFAVAFVDIGLDINDDRNVDGLRVMERIRATDDDTSIIVVTGRSGQDVLSITRDALKEYSAYDAVGKSSVAPSNIRQLLEGALKEYQGKATAASHNSGYEALRGDADAMGWDDRLTRAISFKGSAPEFYDFLNRLVRDYLPIVTRSQAGQLDIDSSTGLVSGDDWSRAIAAAITICFGATEQFNQAMGKDHVDGVLPGKSTIGKPLKELASHGVKGAVYPLAEGCREDFGEKPAE